MTTTAEKQRKRKTEDPVETMKFFFYGIFLRKSVRDNYHITSEPRYETIKDYATFGSHIVEAKHIPNCGLALTGIVVDVPVTSIPGLDRLEGGYDRKTIKTESGEEVQMYVEKERNKDRRY